MAHQVKSWQAVEAQYVEHLTKYPKFEGLNPAAITRSTLHIGKKQVVDKQLVEHLTKKNPVVTGTMWKLQKVKKASSW